MNNLNKIQQQLERRGLDALLITDEKNQRYALGFPFTDGAVLIARRGAWLFTDSRYIEAAELAAGDIADIVLFDAQHPLTDCIRTVISREQLSRIGAEEEKLSHAGFLRYEKALGVKLEAGQTILSTLRSAKSEEEIAAMREAQGIAEAALAETLLLIRPGMSEREIAAELVYRMLRHGGEGNSFDPIVVTGKKTSMPHGVPGDELVEEGDFVTMDFGCLYKGYCSDMTRTVALGFVTEEMDKVYHTVLEAQLAGIAVTKAGVAGRDIDGAARKVIADAGYGAYFGHGYGHSLGLEIHEAPNANPSNDQPMPAGAVCSAEPGIYLPGKFGVRIEDVTVITENGAEVLTKSPKNLIIL